MAAAQNEPSLIKKYANRRLYHTAISQYITLDDVAEMVRKGEDFKIVDAKTGKDLTRSILAQILVDEEAKGESMLPISFLRQLITLYSDSMRPFVPHYLEQSMQAFVDNQEEWAKQFENSPLMQNPEIQKMNQTFEGMAKQNIAVMEQAMKIFNPFMNKNDSGDK